MQADNFYVFLQDFPFPTNVVSFCQPEGCIVLNGKKVGKKETAFFIFTLTDKDSGEPQMSKVDPS